MGDPLEGEAVPELGQQPHNEHQGPDNQQQALAGDQADEEQDSAGKEPEIVEHFVFRYELRITNYELGMTRLMPMWDVHFEHALTPAPLPEGEGRNQNFCQQEG